MLGGSADSVEQGAGIDYIPKYEKTSKVPHSPEGFVSGG
jgi:hypothetical protein